MNAKMLKIFIPISLLIILITIGICCLVKKTRQPNPDNIGPNLNEYNNEKKTIYQQDLQAWKNQCYFKPGKYTGYQVRDKLGKTSKWLYSNEDSKVEGIKGTIRDKKLYYKYDENFLIDDWYLQRYESGILNILEDLIIVGTTVSGDLNNEFFGYFDTTQPPNPYDDKYRFTYYEDGKTIKSISDYNNNEKLSKKTWYQPDRQNNSSNRRIQQQRKINKINILPKRR